MLIVKYKLNGRKCSVKVSAHKGASIIAKLIASGVRVTTVISK